jgi:uncharacterized protein with PIN domain
MFDHPKFITDAALAKLAKWLRLLGCDTVVFHKEAGREMLRLAQIEGRIVLTRRYDMTRRQFSGCLYLIEGKDISSQLNDVINRFSLKINKKEMFGICLKCNKKLNSVSGEGLRNLVPPYVFENCASFNKCPSCQNIFWEGTHQRNSLQFLEKHINNFQIK